MSCHPLSHALHHMSCHPLASDKNQFTQSQHSKEQLSNYKNSTHTRNLSALFAPVNWQKTHVWQSQVEIKIIPSFIPPHLKHCVSMLRAEHAACRCMNIWYFYQVRMSTALIRDRILHLVSIRDLHTHGSPGQKTDSVRWRISIIFTVSVSLSLCQKGGGEGRTLFVCRSFNNWHVDEPHRDKT